MRILLNDPAYVDDLVAYLRRCGCSAEVVGRGVVDAMPPHAELEQSYLRMELDAYLRVWREMRGDVKVELLEPTITEEALG
jgi:hypothetical protein